MNKHDAEHKEPAHRKPGLPPKALAESRSDAMRRRARQIRKSIVMLTTALFVAAFLAVYVQLASGHDPALTANAKARTTASRLLARAASSKAAEQAAARKAAAAAAAKRTAEAQAAEQAESSTEASETAAKRKAETAAAEPAESSTKAGETSATTTSSEPVTPVTTSQS